jgi:hypothetical protein
MIARILTLVLVVLLVVPIAEESHPAEAKKKGKSRTITRTFSSNDQFFVPAAGTSSIADPYPATIEVDGFKKYKRVRIKDVNVTLRDYLHSNPDDVNVMLSFGNRRAVIMGSAGGTTGILSTTVVLNDEAGTDLPCGDGLTDGTYRPTNCSLGISLPYPAPDNTGDVALSTFDGANPKGTWRLWIYDDNSGGIGYIDSGWSLEITAKVKDKKKNKKKH